MEKEYFQYCYYIRVALVDMNSEYLCSHSVIHFQCLWLFGFFFATSGMCRDGWNRTQFYSIHSLHGGKILISGRDEMRKNQLLSVCVCVHIMRVGMVLVIRPYDTIYIVTNIQARARK